MLTCRVDALINSVTCCLCKKTLNQVVGYNLARARRLKGWTQVEAGQRIEDQLGQRWSVATVSAAEKSFDSKSGRVRQFTADEIVAFSLAFDLPITWLFFPPSPDDLPNGRFAPPRGKQSRPAWRHSPGNLRAEGSTGTLGVGL
jgi:transcriptional regulator with XRE-family HTH domain